MLILIDNGHGLDTPGKRSPDGKFLEATYTREIARRVVADLIDRGYNAQLLVPEPEDIPLSERVRRINTHCNTLGKSNVIVISIHVNAAGNGSQWLNATGWSCYTSKGQTTSDLFTECFYVAAKIELPRTPHQNRHLRRRHGLGRKLLHPKKNTMPRSPHRKLLHGQPF